MIERYNYRGDPNIGFNATVTSNAAIYPPEFKQKDYFDKENEVETFIGRTRLVGLFTAGNKNCILVPRSVTDRERGKLDESGINYHVLESNENALGNLILVNNNGAMISPKLEDKKDEIEDALEVPVTVGKIAGLPGVGVNGAANKHGALLHRETTEEEAEKVAEALQVEDVDIGTINLGSPYVGSGIICDNENVLVGEDTSGPEIGRIDRTLQKHE
jgi:translation initiation factor 6